MKLNAINIIKRPIMASGIAISVVLTGLVNPVYAVETCQSSYMA